MRAVAQIEAIQKRFGINISDQESIGGITSELMGELDRRREVIKSAIIKTTHETANVEVETTDALELAEALLMVEDDVLNTAQAMIGDIEKKIALMQNELNKVMTALETEKQVRLIAEAAAEQERQTVADLRKELEREVVKQIAAPIVEPTTTAPAWFGQLMNAIKTIARPAGADGRIRELVAPQNVSTSSTDAWRIKVLRNADGRIRELVAQATNETKARSLNAQ